MNLQDGMNKAIDYIERNLNGEIDYEEAARICGCSLGRFQNLFQFVAGATPSEYVRKRRMTFAAEELISGNEKIIDLSMKFGYESPEAFARAFQNFHGYPPSVTRKFGAYKKFNRLSVRITIQGGCEMETHSKSKILKGVRPVGWGQTTANPYVGAITACVDALRNNGSADLPADPNSINSINSEYGDFRYAGMISGVGFSYTWSTAHSNDANMVDDATIIRTFGALGYRVGIYRDGDTQNAQPSREKSFYAEKIISSVDRGFPVLGFGFTTDYPYACAIVGYENECERLYLRSYWEGDVPIGSETRHQTAMRDYQVMEDWYKYCRGIVVIEEKVSQALAGKNLLRHCLNAAVELSAQKTIEFYDLVLPCGLASYDAMVAVLEDDSFWAMRDEAFLRGMDKSYSCVGLLLADHYRNWIARYWLAERADSSEAGKFIAEACEYYSLFGWLINKTTGGHEGRTFLADPLDLEKREARLNMVPLIKILKRLDGAAVECFKKALELL